MSAAFRIVAVLLAVAATSLAALAPRAEADFDVDAYSTSLVTPGFADAPEGYPFLSIPSGQPVLAAGAHPQTTVKFRFASDPNSFGGSDGTARTAAVDFPAGFNINLGDVPACPREVFLASQGCPNNTEIGTAQVTINGISQGAQLFNLPSRPGVPVEAGLNVLNAIVVLQGSLRPEDNGITVTARPISTAVSVTDVLITLWGDPNNPDNESGRGARRVDNTAPLTSNPTSCSGQPLNFVGRATSYEDPQTTIRRDGLTNYDGTPHVITDCASLPFDPAVTVTPTTTAPDSPTGLDVVVDVPQAATAAERSPAHLKDLSLLLPEGMNVNPSAADGRQSCSLEQIGLGTADAARCPDASTLGDVSIDTPLLPDPLTGKLYLAAQNANPFNTTLALYLVANGPGVVIKLPGRVDADPVTGRLRVTFSDAPQLAFSRLRVSLSGGNRAILTTPATCGPQTVAADVTPWSGAPTRSLSSSFAIDCTPGLGGFAPTFSAGTASIQAGQFAPLQLAFGRPDGQQALSNVSVTLPPGLLARPAAVTPCTDAQATADACPATSKVGSARVTAGAGPAPFPVGGEAFLTGPYKGAPYGLLVRFRVIAGPLDLGVVTVRQALSIDPEDAHVTAVSDPLPTIVSGIPIRLRDLALDLDQPQFTLNPTSCAPKAIGAALGGAGGAVANLASRFAVGRCENLLLSPQLRLSLTGRRSALRRGGHPGISARLTQPAGQSNLRRVEVKLPLSLALDPDNARALCDAPAAATATPDCPEGSAIGTATVRTPLLPEPLTGPVYFVQGVRTTSTGRQVRTLPRLVLPLRGNGVQINVRANTAVRDRKLVAQFDPIPDAPISRFDFRLDGGRNGVLVATRGVCGRSRSTSIRFRGHSGKLVTATRSLRAACGR